MQSYSWILSQEVQKVEEQPKAVVPTEPDQQCWQVTYTQGGVEFTVYGWLTKEELLENIQEMQNDATVSNIGYQPADAADKHACEELFDKAK